MSSARKKLVIGNWKMNLDNGEALSLIAHIEKLISASAKVDVAVCPSFVALELLHEKLEPLKLKLGVQNVHYVDHGPFTGEVSASMVREFVDFAIIGHSERRAMGETNDVIARKVSAAMRNGITPVLCVGENLFERQDGETGQVVHDQLAAGLVMLTGKEVAKTVIAYEPVWAIGTGEIAQPEQVKEAIGSIRKTIAHQYGETVASAVRVVYGGSVVAEFAEEYIKVKNLDGFLVGGASLKPVEFASIVKTVQRQGSKKIAAAKN